ncbi:MAG: hypothetical protein DWP97_13290 [Calditrichaeota bacterium]|nr:MAG: hypothetical protein DWP97_13290 [Calditrichota bacterium]
MNPKLLASSIIAIFIMFGAVSGSVSAIEQTVGLQLHTEESYEGYTLFSPNSYNFTYLIDNDGQLVHSWEHQTSTRMSIYLREDGLLLKTAIGGEEFGLNGAGVGGTIQLIDWDGNIVWEYLHADSTYRQHHDVEPLPNGNILVLAWEKFSPDEAIAAGRDSTLLTDGELWAEHVYEIEPIIGTDSVNIIWEWHVWDHLIQEHDSTKENFGVVYDHPELIDLNYPSDGQNPGRADWLHFNDVAYNPVLDQILVSSNRNSEILIIDHSTTTIESAGHSGGNSGKGGDILFRWGNPQTYQRGDSTNQRLYGTHDGYWIPQGYPGAGNLLLFNNGFLRPEGNYSSIEEFAPPIDSNGNYLLLPDQAYEPDSADWTYISDIPTDFYSSRISGMQRLQNGNTLICSGMNGRIFEINNLGTIVWEYINPVTASGPNIQGEELASSNQLFRAERYPLDYPAFIGRDLLPEGYVEIYPPCCLNFRGNVNADENDIIDISDLVFFVDYSFGGSGIEPECLEEADVDASTILDIGDLVYLVEYMFDSGPEPVTCP